MASQNVDEIMRDPSFMDATRGTTTFLPEPVAPPWFCPIISTDDHLLEPPDVFVDRVPKRLRDSVPRMEDDSDGVPYWLIDGRKEPIQVANGAVGRPFEEWNLAPQKFSDFRPGVSDVHARAADMELSGVWASVLFPSLPWGFAGKAFSFMKDPEVGLASLRAYNDWLIEEWCGALPDRFIASQVAWFLDPVVAAEEVRRNAARGFRGISFSESPEGLGFPSIHSGHWDPLFAACEETETVINLHVGSSGSITRPSTDSPRDVLVALFPLNGIMSLVDWVFSEVPVRFPDIKIALSEGGVSWVPMAFERLERAFRQRAASGEWRSDLHPVDVARRNFWFTSIEDPVAFQLLELIGVDRVTIEQDYPHMDSTWPDTQSLVKDELAHLSPEVVKRVCFGNAADLYRHPHPPADWMDRSEVGRGWRRTPGGELAGRYAWWRSEANAL